MKKIILLIFSFSLLFSLDSKIKLFSFKQDALKFVQSDKNATIQSVYKVKLASFVKLENAKKFKTKPDMYIHKLEKYYGVFSNSYKSKKEAKEALKRYQKIYKDAYVVELFQIKQITPKKKKISKKQLPKLKSTPKLPLKQTIKPIIIKKQKLSDFEQGMERYNEGSYEDALMAFDRVLINDPNNQRARLEYAKTLFMLKLYPDSQREFEKVLKTNPPKNVVENINFFLASINQRKKRNFFFGSVGVGVAYDDNINNNTFLATTSYADFNISNDTNKTKSLYETFELQLSHLYIADLFKITNSFFTYNEFGYDNRIDYINIGSNISKNFTKTKFALGININKIFIGGDENSYSFIINSLANYVIQKNFSTTFKLSVEKYNSQEDSNKSSNVLGGEIGINYKFLNSYLGYKKYSKEQGDRFDVAKNDLYFSSTISYVFYKDIITNFGYYFLNSKYIDIYEYEEFDIARKDTRHKVNLSFRYYILKKLSTEFKYSYTNNRSNINTYSYNKNNFLLKVNYDF